ncbi:cytochrome P450 [Leucogyrophana mollusca]|uniref:Cytochrome P450 n=1 Tax=Leucogyrophana mollusca TaxID=85980 RepID=A0ACB8BMQ0_9AGAM|nr:cytochrome P450 [Leucogyrophana mollusca]
MGAILTDLHAIPGMSWKTPGVVYLTRWVLSVLLPCACLVFIVVRGSSFAGLSLPSWLVSTLLLVCAPLGFFVYITFGETAKRRRAATSGARMVPRVRGRWLGNLDVLMHAVNRAESDYIGQLLQTCTQDIGSPTVNLWFLWEDIIVTTEPNHVKTILATDFHNYIKGEKFYETAVSVLGTGVFNSDGETWKHHRTMTRPFFNRDRIGHFDIFDRHADQAVNLMKERFRSGLAIDFQDLISRFTLDSATEFLCGHDVHTLSATLPYPYNISKPADALDEDSTPQTFARAFSEAQHGIARRNMVGQTWPLAEIFADRTAKPMELVNAFLDPIIQDAIEKHKRSENLEVKDESADDEALLDHLVRLTTDGVVLKDEVLNILLAGRDTTASTLTSAIYLLALHPEALGRLREEIITKVGPTRRPTYDDIREMKFLRAVLNETLRLFPAVPFNVRESVNDTIWSSPNPEEKPLFIPAGTTVTYSVLLMHRRTDLWGPDAQEFDPDRFLDERLHKYLTKNPFIFMPFNAGPRICLGQQFAYNEMSFMLIRLLQNFSSISLAPDAQDPATLPPAEWAKGEGRQAIERFRPRAHLTLYAKGGMWVKMGETESI